MDCGHLFRLNSDPANHNGIFPQLTNRCKEQEKSFHNKNIKVFSISGFCASFLRAETCFTDFISMGLHNYKHFTGWIEANGSYTHSCPRESAWVACRWGEAWSTTATEQWSRVWFLTSSYYYHQSWIAKINLAFLSYYFITKINAGDGRELDLLDSLFKDGFIGLRRDSPSPSSLLFLWGDLWNPFKPFHLQFSHGSLS